MIDTFFQNKDWGLPRVCWGVRIASTRGPPRGWGGPRVVAIGRKVKSEKLGSPIQLCVWGPAKGFLSFLH